jgi:hypothetical protein
LSREDVVVIQGTLLMKNGKYFGDYRVLLDGQHWGGEMSGLARSMMLRRNMQAGPDHPLGPPDSS